MDALSQTKTQLDGAELPERFELIRQLGEGGFGRVYAVNDRARESLVALKMLSNASPKTILSFKDEFRNLADLVHPNLVTLYELYAQQGSWFFTMELVRGLDFLAYVRGHEFLTAPKQNTVRATADSLEADVPQTTEFEEEDVFQDTIPPLAGVGLEEATADFGWFMDESYDESRLRDALGQLGSGIKALHDAGMLHRDIKPSNVLVREDGHLLLLDFGLISQMTPSLTLEHLQKARRNRGGQFVGTPHYMSPEQAMGMTIGPASDWYAVGAMLYEVLTGRRPIEGGTPLQILLRKQSVRPAHVLELASDAPEDLAELCMRLLERQPASRAGYAEIVATLGQSPARTSGMRRAVARSEARPFVGRAQHLATMRRALERSSEGRAAAFVNVIGPSGMGKSALVRQFLRSVSQDSPDVLILEGRCFENETVPYKALDQLVDWLSRYLELLPQEDLGGFAEIEGLSALVRLFPSLERVPVIEDVVEGTTALRDASQQRRLAFEALRQCFQFLGSDRQLLLYIDDVQWGDEDSAALIEHVMRAPDAPPILLLTSFREEDLETSPFLLAFLEHQRQREDQVVVETLRVGALEEAEAAQLAQILLANEPDMAPPKEHLDRIAQEAAGNPLFIDELARYMRNHSQPSSSLTELGEVLYKRIVQLPESARRLLEVISVAGQPLERQVARVLAKLEGEEQSALALLRTELLVRQSSDAISEGLETYHARIRETVVSKMDDGRRVGMHSDLAEALSEREGTDPELVARHYIAAEKSREAVPYLWRAAEQAGGALAFERAARLWEMTLEYGEWSSAEVCEINARHGEVLGYLGRGGASAKAYLEARSHAETRAHARQYERLAGEQLLRGGRFEEGRQILEGLLEELRVRMPRRGAFLLAELLALRARIAWRGLSVKQIKEISEEKRERLDLCWSAAQMLSALDLKVGAYFGALHLLDALDSGDPTHACLSLALEATHLSGSSRTRARGEELLKTARALVESEDVSTYAEAFLCFGEGMSAYLGSDWRHGLERMQEAEHILETRCQGVVWELDGARLYQFFCMEMLGTLKPFVERLPRLLDEAVQRDDLLYTTNWKLWSYRGHLANDDPDRARRVLDGAIEAFGQESFLIQHLWHLVGAVNTALYQEQPERAFAMLEDRRQALKGSLLLQNETIALFHDDLEQRTGLALMQATQDAREQKRARSHAERYMRALEKSETPAAALLALMGNAQLQWASGERKTCVNLLEEAEEKARALRCDLHLHAILYWRASILGKSAEDSLKAAERWFTEHGVINPRSMVRCLVPLFATT